MRRRRIAHFHRVGCDGKIFRRPICEIEGESQLVLGQEHGKSAGGGGGVKDVWLKYHFGT